MTLPAFVGDQTPKIFDDSNCAYFTHRYEISPGKLTMSMSKTPLKIAKKYKNIEDILSDVSLLPLAADKYDFNTLRRHIALDSMSGFPEFFPEFSILAYASKSDHDRPIVFINDPNGPYYVAHPEISKFIRRVPVGTGSDQTV